MSDQTVKDENEIMKQTSTMLMALGEDLFPMLDALDLDARAAAIDCLFTYAHMPAEVALRLLVDPLEVGETIASDPALSGLMMIAQISALAKLGDVEDIKAAVEDLHKIDNEAKD